MDDRRELWRPQAPEDSHITAFQRHVESTERVSFADYSEFHRWSTASFERFWQLWCDYSQIIYEGSTENVFDSSLPTGQQFFSDLRLNFAENLLRHHAKESHANHIALIAISEARQRQTWTYSQLSSEVAQWVSVLRNWGIQPGDCVAGYLPNIAETVVAMLATTFIGGIWTSTSPDFGPQGVIDRFGQTQPKVLFTVDGYRYGGKAFDLSEKLKHIVPALKGLEHVVVVEHLGPGVQQKLETHCISWTDAKAQIRTSHTVPAQRFPV